MYVSLYWLDCLHFRFSREAILFHYLCIWIWIDGYLSSGASESCTQKLLPNFNYIISKFDPSRVFFWSWDRCYFSYWIDLPNGKTLHCSIKIIVHPPSEKCIMFGAHQYQIYSDVPDLDKFHDASETFVVMPIWPGPLESGVQGGNWSSRFW